MVLESTRDLILKLVNQARGEAGHSELQCCSYEESMDLLKASNYSINGVKCQEDNDEDVVNASVEVALAAEIASDSAVHNAILSKDYTHIDCKLTNSTEEEAELVLILYSKFLDVEAPGQVIDGDLVIQGKTLKAEFGPALCVVDFAFDHDEEFQNRVCVVNPWEMMFAPSESGEDAGFHTFAIPIQLPSDKREAGTVRVKIYVDEISRIPYNDESPEYDSSGDIYILTNEFTTRNSYVGEGKELEITVGEDLGAFDGDMSNLPQDLEGQLQLTELDGVDGSGEGKLSIDAMASPLPAEKVAYVREIRIALDYDELQALRSEGFDVHCICVTPEGLQDDQEHLWKFFIACSYETYDPANPHDHPDLFGLEDIVWVKCLKSMGSLPVMPYFEILHDNDLTNPDDDYSVFLAVKMGAQPRFRGMSMLSCNIENEELLQPFIDSRRGIFRQAPVEICNLLGGPSGILLETVSAFTGVEIDGSPTHANIGNNNSFDADGNEIGSPSMREALESLGESPKASRGALRKASGLEQDDDVSHVTSADNSDDDDFGNEEDAIETLARRVYELQLEKERLESTHLDVQRRAALLIAREKMLQGQNSTARNAAEAAQQAVQDAELMQDQMMEKEKQFQEMLQLITEGRAKLARQQAEFDQLALDLQTRLDDKEFKATEITESFRKFKREILSKSVNSRTGLPLSKRQISQVETSEQKREEDLEKVRLRNISLRTTLKKLERTLRAREQLAEGLHMIDFEQLKIENQTLNEKIEERNEELSKLKRKKTTTVQILTHVREKSRFIDKVNEGLRGELTGLESEIVILRGNLTTNKHDRDSVRLDIKELKRQQGFATSDLLIVDYENRKVELEAKKAAVREYKDRYEILMRQVEQANSITKSPLVPIGNKSKK